MNNKGKSCGDDEDDDSVGGILPVYTSVNTQKRFTVNLDEYIQEPSYYRNVIHMLDNASEDDIVIFHINSKGGNIHTTMQLVTAMQSSSAGIIGVCHGVTASAATMIALECDEIHVTPGNSWLVHQPSWGTWGKTSEVRDEVEFFTKENVKLCERIYEGFMTQEEIDDMIETRKDVFMDEDEVKERLIKRNKYFQEMAEKQLVKEQPKPARKRAAKKSI